MDKKSDENDSGGSEPQENRRGSNSLLIALILAGLVVLLFYNRGEERSLVSASFFQEQLANNNIEQVRIGELRVYGTFKIRPDAPPVMKDGVKTVEKGEDGQPLKYLRKFAFNRSTDAGWVVKFEDQLEKAGVKDFGFLDRDNTQQIMYFIVLIGLPLAILFFIHDASANTQRHHGRGFLIGL